MAFHRPRTPSLFSSLANWRSLNITLIVLAWIASAGTAAAAQEPAACGNEIESATSKMDGLPAGIEARVGRGVRNASALSRFHRSNEALAKLDAVVALLDSPRGERLKDRTRTELTKSIHALRTCLALAEPAPLTTLTIHVFVDDGNLRGGAGKPAGGGVYLDVEGILIGRTGSDGTLQADVPSGTIRIRATEYPSSVGEEVVTLSTGTYPTVSIVMSDDKEPSEDSDLLLEEAPDGILPASATSLTLTFVQDDGPVRIQSVDEIELSDAMGNAGEDLKPLFKVIDGVVRATDTAAVYGRIAAHSRIGRPMSLVAQAIDSEGRAHYGDVRFHYGQFKLAVRLAPPPSNPALPVSNVRVRVSVVGTDVAMSRISDADGRFEIESLPDASLAFDAHAVASGVHYYADATLTLCADRSVTLLMLNVKDLVAGVPALINPGTPPCPPVPRR